MLGTRLDPAFLKVSVTVTSWKGDYIVSTRWNYKRAQWYASAPLLFRSIYRQTYIRLFVRHPLAARYKRRQTISSHRLSQPQSNRNVLQKSTCTPRQRWHTYEKSSAYSQAPSSNSGESSNGDWLLVLRSIPLLPFPRLLSSYGAWNRQALCSCAVTSLRTTQSWDECIARSGVALISIKLGTDEWRMKQVRYRNTSLSFRRLGSSRCVRGPFAAF